MVLCHVTAVLSMVHPNTLHPISTMATVRFAAYVPSSSKATGFLVSVPKDGYIQDVVDEACRLSYGRTLLTDEDIYVYKVTHFASFVQFLRRSTSTTVRHFVSSSDKYSFKSRFCLAASTKRGRQPVNGRSTISALSEWALA